MDKRMDGRKGRTRGERKERMRRFENNMISEGNREK